MSKVDGIFSILPRFEGEGSLELFLNNESLVVLDGLKYAKQGGVHISGASALARVTTLAGTTLGNSTLAYVTGSAGRYEGTFSVITSLVEGTEYVLKVSAISSGNTIGFWQHRLIATYRRD
ncbi:hypothetical protein LCGC14_2562530 [marine sediment metagenome]|uniref:Uncharacterized protein n=1 Tax=marine sediment metagenome TaxID=412755 RepID=A0A0F9AK84_9ZZZZ